MMARAMTGFISAARRGPVLLAATLVVAALSATAVGRADSRPGSGEAPATAPDAAELRNRFAGFYRYAGDAAEQKARTDAIDRIVGTFFFAVRDIVRGKLEDRTRIMATFRLAFADGNVRSTVPGLPVAVSPETGATAPYRIGDDPIALSQHFEGSRFIQVFTADNGGSRRNEFTLSPDGTRLTMRATLSGGKLSKPLVYTLTYQRAE